MTRRLMHRVDENQPQMVEDLRKCGYLVIVNNSTPDLSVKDRGTGRITLLEVDGVTRNRKRTKAQLDLLELWKIPRVKTTEQALVILQDPKRW